MTIRMSKNRRNNKNRNKSTRRRRVARTDSPHRALNITRFSPRTVYGFPPKLLTKLRYHSASTLTSTTGGLTSYKFRWNSCYDPDLSGGGHQPSYFDTFSSVYDQYAVIRATATVRFTNTTSAPFYVGAVTDDDGSIASGIDAAMEQSTSKSLLITPLSGSNSGVELVFKWDCVKYLTIDPFTSEQYKASVASDPSETSILAVYAASADSSTNTMQFDIMLEQEVLFTELKTLVLS